MLIDTHGHLNFNAFSKDLDAVIARTLQAGMRVVIPGSQYATSKRAVELAEQYKGLYAAIGLHPIHVGEKREVDIWETQSEGKDSKDTEGWEEFITRGENFNKEAYSELAKNKKVVAIGEIGLDYYRIPKGKAKRQRLKDLQKEVLRQQLAIALYNNLPVIIHCRVAFKDTLDLLKERGALSKEKPRGVIHSYTGTIEQAKEFIELGFFIGFNGLILKNVPALPDPQEVISSIPLERIVLETDAPYLTPPMASTARNEPLFVDYVAKEIARIKGVAFEEVAEATSKNATTLFSFS